MAGDVVWDDFPFTDLSGSKDRPVLLLADVGMRDWIACEITSAPSASYAGAIAVAPGDLRFGRLSAASRIRPDRLATLNERTFRRRIGRLTDAKLAEVQARCGRCSDYRRRAAPD